MNMIQLGRVLHEAKKLVRHGEWGKWVRDNAGFGERNAQLFMQGYLRFGENALFSNIDKSKLFKMIALTVGTEVAFLEENDISGMSARDVEAAVKDFNDKSADASEDKAALDGRSQAMPEKAPDMQPEKQPQAEERTDDSDQSMLTKLEELRAENARQKDDLREANEMLEESERQKKDLQSDLLDTKSSIARGDTARTISDAFTPDVFGAAVRQFIGTCARLPHMGQAFSDMTHDDREQYDQLLRTVEAWTKDARMAMDTIIQEGIIK